MEIKNVGVLSPGDMGSAIARRIKESGKNTYTASDGRSERTKTLGREAGLTQVIPPDRVVGCIDRAVVVVVALQDDCHGQ